MSITSIPIRPTNKRALVLRDDAVKQFGALFVPDASQELPLTGTVVSISKGSEDACEFQVGDSVWFSKYGGQQLKVEGVEYLLLKYDEIIAVAVPPEA